MRIPTHVAIIMDGNGRWAKARLLPRGEGHRQGMNRMIDLADYAFSVGVKYLTVYALSTENLSRPQEELDGLFSLFRKYFKKNVKRLLEKNIRIRIIGDITALPFDIQQLIEESEKESENNTAGCINIALNYGARQEIVRACNEAMRLGKEVTEEEFSALLYTKNQPDPDLIIRTGREKRISNFLLYQAAYSEFYFTDVMFPDFSNAEFDKALADFSTRKRRFGKTDEQIDAGK
ncbi:MAG: di-trans,poly-cis-decaprenylcistransferase [Clostridia bacterium]|nr:di-trans,poly-cis-decaprenylcistransferase [Clostridia bacterium]